MTTITKAQLARRAAEKLRILAPNEIFSAEDQATIEAEIDSLKEELEVSILDGSILLWEDDTAIPSAVAQTFLFVLLPTLAPHYGVEADDSAVTGYRRLCRMFAVPFDRETFDQTQAQ